MGFFIRIKVYFFLITLSVCFPFQKKAPIITEGCFFIRLLRQECLPAWSNLANPALFAFLPDSRLCRCQPCNRNTEWRA